MQQYLKFGCQCASVFLNLMIVMLCLTFLTKLRISEIQINEEDYPIDELIKQIGRAMLRRRIMCFLITLIGIIFIVNDALEEFYLKESDKKSKD